MTEKAFRRAVYLRKPPGVSQTALDAAIEYFVSVNKTEQRDVKDCIVLADRFDASITSAKDNGHSPTKRLTPLTPGLLARSNSLTALITPDVEQLRQEVFGNPQPPFSSYEDAAEWIGKVGEQQDDLSLEERQRRQELRKEIYDKLLAWSKLTGDMVQLFPFVERNLPFIERVNGALWLQDYPVRHSFPLAKLEEVSRRLATLTSFPPHSVVSYILIGKKPLLKSVDIHFQPNGSDVFGMLGVLATVEINTPDVTDKQIRAIRGEIREVWGKAKTKPSTEADAQLYDFVRQFGKVPEKRGQAKAFWDKVYAAWRLWCEREHRPQRFTTARSMCEKYRPLERKLRQTPDPVEQWGAYLDRLGARKE